MSLMLTAGIAVTLLAQGSGTDLLAKHTAALQAAKSLKVTFTVANLPAAPQTYTMELSKPGFIRVETPTNIYLSDGEKYAEYDKSRNEYILGTGDARKLLDSVKSDELLVWAAFFYPDQFKGLRNATVGQKISMKGTPVTEVKIAGEHGETTVFMDTKENVARGAEFKLAKNGVTATTLVIASDLKIGSEAFDAGVFALGTLPADAKKVEISAGDLAKWYYNLDEGLKVAKATNRMVFLDFNATWCGPCQMYKRNVFPTEEFKAMGKYFVFVDIDTDDQSGLARQYGVSDIPDLRFLKPDGTEVHKVVGYKGMALLDDMRTAMSKAGVK